MTTSRRVGSDEAASVPDRGHILVVDDDHDVRDAVGGALEDAGYAVTLARNGAEALNALRQVSLPDLIVLDLAMPELNGPEFLEEALHDPTYSGIPIVVVTGASLGNEEAAALGADGYLQKPISAAQLLEAVERARCDWDDEVLALRTPG